LWRRKSRVVEEEEQASGAGEEAKAGRLRWFALFMLLLD
jgi:hypothetical protein